MAHCCRCAGSLLAMCWLIVGDVVAHCWRCGGSLEELHTSGAEFPGSNPASPARILVRCRIIVNTVQNLRVFLYVLKVAWTVLAVYN